MLVIVVLAMLCRRFSFLPAIGVNRSKTKLQRHAHQEKDR